MLQKTQQNTLNNAPAQCLGRKFSSETTRGVGKKFPVG